MTQHRYSLTYNLTCGVNIFVPVFRVRINMEEVNIHPDILLIAIVKNLYTVMK